MQIYSYKKVWQVKTKLYSLGNIRLPFAVDPYELAEFVAIAGIVFVLGYLFPVITYIPTILRFIAFPYFVTSYLMKKKLDGKNPIKYFMGLGIYLVTVNGTYREHLKGHPKQQKKVVLDWNCSMGNN